MLGWGHNSRGVETRHCRPHPQTRQTEEGARQLQTHLPDIPPRESVRTGDQEQTRILLWIQESVPRVPGRFPTGTGCHRPPGETGWARREGNREEKGPTDVLLWHLPCLRPGLACQAATETQQDRNFWQHVQLHQILPERQIDAGQVEGSHVDHQRSKYGRSSGICDRPPVVQHHGPRRGHGSERKGSADHVRRRPGDMDGHPLQTSPHKQLVGETKHETVPGSCGRGGPLYASKWIRSLFPENCVPPIPHQHLSEHGGAHQGERAEHLCIERSQVPWCTLHSLGAYEPAGRAQRAERLPSPQRDQGAICSDSCYLPKALPTPVLLLHLWPGLRPGPERGSAGLDGVEVATRPMHPYPPWLLERAHVEVDMEGLKKDQNPLVIAVTARLCLEEKYQHHLKIYTDGSVMEDGAAGAAFVIPEFNNLTHSYSLPAVSVFTAELLAISMALQHISVIPVTPFAIVICSDSKAALTAIKSDSQNAREDLVREIATTTHQLITRGTEVRFQWVPAHVCLSGNEKADRAAKRGAKGVDSSNVTMKIGLADVYAELTKQVWKQWEKEFHPMATAKEWDDTSPPCRAGVFFPGIPTYLARIMHRLHVGVWRCMCVPTKCECGMSVSFHHVMFSCTTCSDHFQPLTGKLRSVGLPLCTKSLAVCDQREGWSLLRAAARLVYTCPLAAYL